MGCGTGHAAEFRLQEPCKTNEKRAGVGRYASSVACVKLCVEVGWKQKLGVEIETAAAFH